MKTLPLGTTYAIWTGIGAVGAAILGMILFGEPRDAGKIICVILIVVGIVGTTLRSIRRTKNTSASASKKETLISPSK